MFIRYDKFELFELFEDDPICVFDEDTGKYIYTKIDSMGMKLIFDLDVYAQCCIVRLSFKENLEDVFYTQIQNIQKLMVENHVLKIIGEDNLVIMTIKFNSNYSIVI